MVDDKILIKNGSHDLTRDTFDDLIKKFQKCHDIIWEGGKRDPASAFDEFSKILMIKVHDEGNTRPNEPYAFQLGKNDDGSVVVSRLEKTYEDVKEKNPSIFKANIKLSEENIIDLVKILQAVSLRGTDLDVKGRAFEQFLGKIFRDEYGQYFTPRTVVKFMVEMMDPTEEDVIIDPACGSGGFLLYCLMHVKERVERAHPGDLEALQTITSAFARDHVFGIEINDMIARIAMMDMVMHDDGHSNIACNNALSNPAEFNKAKDMLHDTYTLILTNPPFGAMVNDAGILSHYSLGKAKKNQKTEVLFIERCLDLLQEHGRLGIVLPDSIFTNMTMDPVRQYILEKARILAIISLPSHAFIPSGAGVKSSLLFLEKSANKEYRSPIFKAIVNHVGFDARGDDDVDELPEVLEEWKKHQQGVTTFTMASLEDQRNFNTKIKRDRGTTKPREDARECQTLGTLSDQAIFIGLTPARKAYTETGFKILKVRDLTGKGIEWDNEERGFVSGDLFQRAKSKALQLNDILFISAAHHPKYIGQKVDIVTHIPERFSEGVICCAEIIVLRLNPDKINPLYVYMYLKTRDGYDAIQSCIRGQTAHIYPKDIKEIEIPIPSKQELDEMDNGLLELKRMLRLKEETDDNLTGSMASLKKAIDKHG